MNGRKRQFFHSNADKNYGPKCEKPDLSPNEVALLGEEHQKKLIENQKDRINIEVLTRDQSNSDLWINLRKMLLTALNFGRICRMRPQTSCSNLVKSLLFPTLNDTPAMAYGREAEDVARKELEKHLSKDIKINGLFIDPIDPRFEILDSRFLRNMPIREPNYIVEAKRQYEATRNKPEVSKAKNNNNDLLEIIDNQMEDNSYISTEKVVLSKTTESSKAVKHKKVMEDNSYKSTEKVVLSKTSESSKAVKHKKVVRTKNHHKSSKAVKRKKIVRTKRKNVSHNNTMHVHYFDRSEQSEIFELPVSEQRNTVSSTLQNVIEDVRKQILNGYDDASDDDVIFTGYNADPGAFDLKAIQSIKSYLETKAINTEINELKQKILNINEWLDDDTMDVFVSILKEN
ncbi:hypothetical protein TSAR_005219 [Trichomalopsis sarcophagae]|uniref:Uncharacterized protein n=1 Tax=Trichomalopsis sarcophagae TaxID=543379 RepID=A0A232ELN9_9HYME|nr:hypothetical protein TSAR_005219 [Trichomalopsis sarcophagae]